MACDSLTFLTVALIATVAADTKCPATCGGAHTCDHFRGFGFSCSDVEAWGCDCSGCACSKTEAVVEHQEKKACPSTCGGDHTCDYYGPFGFECSDMENWGCDCSGCGCASKTTGADDLVRASSSRRARLLAVASPSPGPASTLAPSTDAPTSAPTAPPTTAPPTDAPTSAPTTAPPTTLPPTAPPTTAGPPVTGPVTVPPTTEAPLSPPPPPPSPAPPHKMEKVYTALTYTGTCGAAPSGPAIGAEVMGFISNTPFQMMGPGVDGPNKESDVKSGPVVSKEVFTGHITLLDGGVAEDFLAKMVDPSAPQVDALVNAFLPIACLESTKTPSCQVEVTNPVKIAAGYEYKVVISYVTASTIEALPPVKEGLVGRITAVEVSEQISALLVGTPAASAKFTDVHDGMCSAYTEAWLTIDQPAEAPFADELIQHLPASAGGLSFVSATKEEGLPDITWGKGYGAPCDKDSDCASMSCPACEPEKRAAQHKAANARELAPARHLLFGVGICTKVCA